MSQLPEPDLDGALKALEGDRELLQRIARVFLVQAPRMLEDVRQAVVCGDALALERAAHKIRGSVTNFGANGANDAAWALEQMGREGNLTDALAAQANLEVALCGLQIALVEFSED